MEAPQFPAGPFTPETDVSPGRRAELIEEVARAPALLRQAVAGLGQEQLHNLYKNWTIRQIVHHLADSHVHCYVRFKWTLTENQPTIKPYDEGQWSALTDAREGDVVVPLALFEALHLRWVQLMRTMTAAQFERSFYHPDTGAIVTLDAALCSYAWHCRHHTGQILWLRRQNGW